MAAALAAMGALLGGCGTPPEAHLAESLDSLTSYCTECHNDTDLTAELTLESTTPRHVAEHPDVWEAVVRKLRGNLMPPPGSARPDVDDIRETVSALEDALDAAAAARGATPGNVVSKLLQDGHVEGVSGVSLPMLLRVVTGRNGSLAGAVQRALSGGAEGVVHMNTDRCCDA